MQKSNTLAYYTIKGLRTFDNAFIFKTYLQFPPYWLQRRCLDSNPQPIYVCLHNGLPVCLPVCISLH
jgi:hypothetical protein